MKFLGDPEKRKLYDMYGEEGLNQQGFQNTNPNDIFENFFGMGMGGGGFGFNQRENGPVQGKSIIQNIDVTLEEFYLGKTKKFQISKNILCESCDGHGTSDGKKPAKCVSCKGKGVVFETRQMGPGFIQQMQVTCKKCKGEGENISSDKKCKKCDGSKIERIQKKIEIEIKKGMQDGEEFRFENEGDQAPNVVPGDVMFIF